MFVLYRTVFLLSSPAALAFQVPFLVDPQVILFFLTRFRVPFPFLLCFLFLLGLLNRPFLSLSSLPRRFLIALVFSFPLPSANVLAVTIKMLKSSLSLLVLYRCPPPFLYRGRFDVQGQSALPVLLFFFSNALAMHLRPTYFPFGVLFYPRSDARPSLAGLTSLPRRPLGQFSPPFFKIVFFFFLFPRYYIDSLWRSLLAVFFFPS